MNRAARDALVFVALGWTAYALALTFDAHEVLHSLFARTEAFQIDEFLLALMVTGVLGLIYGVLRVADLRAETRRRAAAETRVEFLAFHDTVTRLHNRHYVDTLLADTCRDRPALKVIYILDLDNFRRVNDIVGHQGGDRLLRTVAARLVAAFPDSVVARIGGDEFLIATTAPDAEAMADTGARIVSLFKQPIDINDVTIECSASVGYAPLARPDLLRDAVVEAEVAMYKAKHDGHGHAVAHDPSFRRDIDARIEIEAQLHQAVNENQIEPYFQPLVRLSTRRLHGFEALARWTKPDGTSVPPMDFIPIAEEAGLITELTCQLLRKACRTAFGWPPHLILSFNISPLQLSDSRLPERILGILEETGFPPRRLSIEITESAVVAELDSALRIIQGLRAAGVRLALDDFGTGYSSLSQLANVPFDKIKIDHSFIQNFLTNDKQMKIVRTVVALGNGLHCATLAEGIEEEEQYDALRDLGCELGQGYLFARPMPADQVTLYLASREASAA